MNIAENEQTNFISKLDNLKEMMNSDLLHNFDIVKCKEKMQKMPLDSFNDAVIKIKSTFNHIKKKDYTLDEERLNAYVAVNMNKILDISTQINGIEDNLVKKSEQLMNEVSVLFSDNYLNNNSKSQNYSTPSNTKLAGFNFDQRKVSEDKPKNVESVNFQLSNIEVAKEFPIDYSVNSNYLDKKFLVFEHSNGETILCYPTSLFSVKLESLDAVINEPKKEAKEIKLSKDVFNQDRKNFNQIESLPINSVSAFPKISDRDKFLKLKLTGHGANIVDLFYYQVGSGVSKDKKNEYEQNLQSGKGEVDNRSLNSQHMNKVMSNNPSNSKNTYNIQASDRSVTDYLITASEDRTIKIWNISDLTNLSNSQNSKINLNNQYNYTSPLLKTLIHQHSIVGIQVFFNPLKKPHENLELVSLSYGDKIRVYDLRVYQVRKDVTTITAANYDTQFVVFNLDNDDNFLVTANHLNQVRVWDYELSKVLHVTSYPDSKVIRLFSLPNPDGETSENVLIVDDKGTNATLNVKTLIMSKLSCKYKSYRTYSTLLDNKNVLFGCKNGTIHRFCFDTLKVEETFDIFNGVSQSIPSGVTCIAKFYHHTYKNLLITHYQNQKMY
eukprot:CAMPEP_0170519980 /NCGR_PEP_ID=MMETSP0209-20121228/5189_1 /TAXON_ID=665100 ORGANISM="Litonotus pictus, Strain P1" /NCGR_SAMPLE_ID=MMETSP0209 /ASSEMBLY_ACC=CAM_ASM_000301 /LENGTH=608 /DNA_ID=CAMNT_0010805991 /DNA_START=402 /DNA_END=2225 /DNA_ORIENTATION=+